MPSYRMKIIDQHGREVLETRVDCWADDRALEIGRNLRSAHSIDIYAGDRHVARIEAEPPSK